jgi:hypothetical protein
MFSPLPTVLQSSIFKHRRVWRSDYRGRRNQHGPIRSGRGTIVVVVVAAAGNTRRNVRKDPLPETVAVRTPEVARSDGRLGRSSHSCDWCLVTARRVSRLATKAGRED